MIVCYFNVISVIVYPRETDTPLIVYADTVLPGTIAFQSFEPIAGRRKQILKIIRFVKVKQFPPGSSLNIRRNLSGNSDVENLVGFFISETFYHFFAHLSKLNHDSQDFKIAKIDLTPQPPSLRGQGRLPSPFRGGAGGGVNPGNPLIL